MDRAVDALDLGVPADAHRRGRLRALPLGASRTSASRPRRCCAGPTPTFTGDRGGLRRRRPRRRSTPPRSSPTRRASRSCARRRRSTAGTSNYGGDRAHVARRLHHPRASSSDRSRRPSTRNPDLAEPAARPVLHATRSTRRQAGWRAWSSRRPCELGIPVPALRDGARLLRRLPQRAAAGQPAPGAARLLRRAHLRAGRPAARRVLPHELDRARRERHLRHVRRMRHALTSGVPTRVPRSSLGPHGRRAQCGRTGPESRVARAAAGARGGGGRA